MPQVIVYTDDNEDKIISFFTKHWRNEKGRKSSKATVIKRMIRNHKEEAKKIISEKKNKNQEKIEMREENKGDVE